MGAARSLNELPQSPYIFDLPPSFSRRDVDEMLMHCVRVGASDVTIQSGDYVWAKIRRIIYRITDRRLESAELELLMSLLRGPESVGIMGKGQALDWAAEVVISRDEIDRFRANATACRVNGINSGMQVTLRSIPGLPPRLDDLKIEASIREALFIRYGLILVVGTTNSGKSTLLASANRFRLESRRFDPVKILTYEDPVEFIYDGLGGGFMPEVSQVQIGQHLRSMSAEGDVTRQSAMEAGRNAMRRGADVIVMGEVRDVETADAALELARTGHATYATLHTETPSQTIERILSFFPSDQVSSIGSQLLGSLKLVVAQKLAPRVDGGVAAYRSWLVFDREVVNDLQSMPAHQWALYIKQLNRRLGTDFESQAFDDFLKGVITPSTYREITSFTKAELIAFAAEKGFDATQLA